MPSPFKTIGDLIEEVIDAVFTSHVDPVKIQQILEREQDILAAVKAMQADIQSIKIFLGAPDATISDEDQAALDAVEKKESELASQAADLANQAGNINTQP